MDNKEANNWRLALLPAALVVVCCAAPLLLGGLAAGVVILDVRDAPRLIVVAALLAVGLIMALVLRRRGIVRTVGMAIGDAAGWTDERRENGQLKSEANEKGPSALTVGDSVGTAAEPPLRVRILKAPGCVTCDSIERDWARLRPEYRDRVEVEVVDLLEQPDLARRYSVLRSPAVVIDDQVRAQGGVDAVRLQALLDQALRERAAPPRTGENTRA
jgi:hypothetical protein